MTDLHDAVRDAWMSMAPAVTWRGVRTGWHAVDLVTLGELVHQSTPAVVVLAGGLGAGGLALFVADCLDQNRRGKLLAGQHMGREVLAAMPSHRRIQWVPQDLLADDFEAAQRMTERAAPVLVVADPAVLPSVDRLAGLVTVGSHLVVHGDTALESSRFPPARFMVDPTRDPVGLSACSWLLRVPT